MTQFRNLVENILKDNNISLNEWDDPDELKYYQNHPEDHTGNGEIEFNLDLPLTDKLRELILSNNIVSEEDLIDDNGKPLNVFFDADVKIEYNISGYPDDEEISVNKVLLNTYSDNNKYVDITQELSKDYLDSVALELENIVELHSYDNVADLRKDYYNNLL